jgi:hypothetical protein
MPYMTISLSGISPSGYSSSTNLSQEKLQGLKIMSSSACGLDAMGGLFYV